MVIIYLINMVLLQVFIICIYHELILLSMMLYRNMSALYMIFSIILITIK